jgi:ATP-dependent exoDNAse (exonuclease V) beta subunit
LSKYKDLKVIFIDEAQDIDKIQYNLINKIANLLNVPLILVGDPNQCIYSFRNCESNFLLNHSDIKYNLNINYRSTPEIVNFANEFKQFSNGIDMKSLNINSNNIPVIIVDSIQNCTNDIIAYLNSTSYKMHEIAIISPVNKCVYKNESNKQ